MIAIEGLPFFLGEIWTGIDPGGIVPDPAGIDVGALVEPMDDLLQNSNLFLSFHGSSSLFKRVGWK